MRTLIYLLALVCREAGWSRGGWVWLPQARRSVALALRLAQNCTAGLNGFVANFILNLFYLGGRGRAG